MSESNSESDIEAKDDAPFSMEEQIPFSTLSLEEQDSESEENDKQTSEESNEEDTPTTSKTKKRKMTRRKLFAGLSENSQSPGQKTIKSTKQEAGTSKQSLQKGKAESDTSPGLSKKSPSAGEKTNKSTKQEGEKKTPSSLQGQKKKTKSDTSPGLPTKSPSPGNKRNKSTKQEAGNTTPKSSSLGQRGKCKSETDLPDQRKRQAGSKFELFKCKASDFALEQLDEFKIQFEEKVTPIDTFFKMLEEKKPIQAGPADGVIKTVKQFIEDQLGNLSIDLNSITEQAKMHFKTKNEEGFEQRLNFAAFNDVKRKAIDNILLSNRSVNKFYTQKIRSGEYNNDEDMLRLFSQWITAVNEFMRSCIDVVRSILHPQMMKTDLTEDDNEKEQNTREIIYQSLFTSFSKIFLLHPRPQRITYKTLLKNYVTSEPDVRFEQTFNLSGAEPATQLMMICEVKRDEPGLKISRLKHDLGKMVRAKIISQVGAELLCECSGSVFSPGAVGILCLRSEILFLFLNITWEHFTAIEQNKSLENMEAKIVYTKSFDILKPEGRSQVMDILFYMARIQTLDFLHPF